MRGRRRKDGVLESRSRIRSACIANDAVFAIVYRRPTDLSKKDMRDGIEAKYSGTSRRREA